MSEIGEQPVGHVAHRVRDAGKARPERGARLGQLEARDQARRGRLGGRGPDTSPRSTFSPR